ncbi:exported protein [Imhoffiella purpurea]|uniref:Murein endopeptidase K n=1 Tax=Imhoffiella purpurea TaxID=1249627 RepID=W9V588_9GAMM|nr:exported protein [Imhoffiella purpurea]
MLSFYHLHTDDRIDVIYRIGDRYQKSALQRLNYFFRDFRTGDVIGMDPRLLDLLYDLKVALGDPDARYHVLSAYRSPETNTMLRRRSRGVAKNSLHLKGKAMDIRFPDLSTRYLRDTAIELSRGGVGYYPRSNFVHVDTGAVRQWRA